MDTLRGNFGNGADPLDGGDDPDSHEDETGREDPPAAIGTDERRMQVRAYNHWAGLLDDRNFPSIEDLDPDALPDFGPYSVLLDFSTGIENPGISYLGKELALECDADADQMTKLDDVPARSLLSRITDHYMQILANQAPIGFEAEFVNQRGQTILYRGILLPFSSDDDTIDFIYGIINWKELADPATADELLLQIDQALDGSDSSETETDAEMADTLPATDPAEMTDWADGPGADVAETDSTDPADIGTADNLEPLELTAQDQVLPEAHDAVDEFGLPIPAYGQHSEQGAGEDKAAPTGVPTDIDEDFDVEDTAAAEAGANEDTLDYAPDSDFALDDFDDEEPSDEYGIPEAPADTGSFASLTEHLSGLGSPRTKKTATELGVVQADPAAADEPISDGEFDLAAYGLGDDEDVDDDGADDASFGSLGALMGGADTAGLGEEDEADEEGEVEQPAEIGHADDIAAGQPVANLDPEDHRADAQPASLVDPVAETGVAEEAADDAAALEGLESDLEPAGSDNDEVVNPSDEDGVTAAATPVANETAAPEGPIVEAPRPEDMELGDWLAVAREQAEAASAKEDRSRAALYEAVGRAYDFAIAAQDAPEDFIEIVEDSGLTMQERAPMTPVVKLVFGADYDKTRITEYATVLTHANRVGVERGELAGYLAKADGGLKGVVATERAFKREAEGMPAKPKNAISEALAKKLRKLPAMDLAALGGDGEEFALVAVRRMPDGSVAVIGEVPHDAKLVAKAARSLLKERPLK